MSSSLRALIVDDERLARQRLLELLLELHPTEIQIVGEAATVTHAAELAEALRPDRKSVV